MSGATEQPSLGFLKWITLAFVVVTLLWGILIYPNIVGPLIAFIKRGGKIWIRIFPDKPITKKPAETRMGSGKGAPAERRRGQRHGIGGHTRNMESLMRIEPDGAIPPLAPVTSAVRPSKRRVTAGTPRRWPG